MLSVSHPVADIMNEGLEIVDAFDFRIINDDPKLWFIDSDREEWRGQELDEQIIRHMLNKRLGKNTFRKTIYT